MRAKLRHLNMYSITLFNEKPQRERDTCKYINACYNKASRAIKCERYKCAEIYTLAAEEEKKSFASLYIYFEIKLFEAVCAAGRSPNLLSCFDPTSLYIFLAKLSRGRIARPVTYKALSFPSPTRVARQSFINVYCQSILVPPSLSEERKPINSSASRSTHIPLNKLIHIHVFHFLYIHNLTENIFLPQLQDP